MRASATRAAALMACGLLLFPVVPLGAAHFNEPDAIEPARHVAVQIATIHLAGNLTTTGWLPSTGGDSDIQLKFEVTHAGHGNNPTSRELSLVVEEWDDVAFGLSTLQTDQKGVHRMVPGPYYHAALARSPHSSNNPVTVAYKTPWSEGADFMDGQNYGDIPPVWARSLYRHFECSDRNGLILRIEAVEIDMSTADKVVITTIGEFIGAGIGAYVGGSAGAVAGPGGAGAGGAGGGVLGKMAGEAATGVFLSILQDVIFSDDPIGIATVALPSDKPTTLYVRDPGNISGLDVTVVAMDPPMGLPGACLPQRIAQLDDRTSMAPPAFFSGQGQAYFAAALDQTSKLEPVAGNPGRYTEQDVEGIQRSLESATLGAAAVVAAAALEDAKGKDGIAEAARTFARAQSRHADPEAALESYDEAFTSALKATRAGAEGDAADALAFGLVPLMDFVSTQGRASVPMAALIVGAAEVPTVKLTGAPGEVWVEDGLLRAEVDASRLSPGRHALTLSATDGEKTAQKRVTLEIRPPTGTRVPLVVLSDEEELLEKGQAMKTLYAASLGSELPPLAKPLVGQDVLLEVKMTDGKSRWAQVSFDSAGRVTELRFLRPTDAATFEPTLLARTHERTLRAVLWADDPAASLAAAVRDRTIAIAKPDGTAVQGWPRVVEAPYDAKAGEWRDVTFHGKRGKLILCPLGYAILYPVGSQDGYVVDPAGSVLGYTTGDAQRLAERPAAKMAWALSATAGVVGTLPGGGLS